MKQETYKILTNQLFTNKCLSDEPYNMEKLFEIFAEQEITTFEDLHNYALAQEFKQFVLDNIDNFKNHKNKDNNSNEEEREIRAKVHKVVTPLAVLKYKFYTHEQETYVKNVEDILGSEKKKILDIGSGEIPYSSFLLAHDNMGKIDSMDLFTLSDRTIENLDCTPHNEYFADDTDIKYYDFIIANRACSAIEPIVKQCAKAKKPYFMRLCHCEAPGGTIDGWKEYLKNIDSKIHFEDDYAFNLDL